MSEYGTIVAVPMDDERTRRNAERQAAREKLFADSKTRKPRVVRLSDAEALTLDDGKDQTRTHGGNWCINCGHLSAFHAIGGHRMCNVRNCQCCVDEIAAEEQARRKHIARLEQDNENLHRRANRWREAVIALVFGGGLTVALWMEFA